MTLGALFAVAFLIVGFAIALFDGKFLFDSGTWFLAAIAPAILGGPVIVPLRRRGGGTA
jgi:hypothetical protein